MKAISLWQPWATAWLLEGQKVFETRSWYTPFRGHLLVHAAAKRDGDVRNALVDPDLRHSLWESGITMESLPFGALIGKVDLIGCCMISRMPEPSDRERMWGLWQPTRFAWERGQFRLFKQPIPYKGSQGFFEVPNEFIRWAE